MQRIDYKKKARGLYEAACRKFAHLNVPFKDWDNIPAQVRLMWIIIAMDGWRLRK